MSEIVRHIAPGQARSIRRELARMGVKAQAALGHVEMEADLQVARVHGLAHVGKQALFAVSMVSELEGQLGQMAPEARDRLAGIADITAFGIAELVAETPRRVSRS